jgi:hypothetical protein
MRRTTTKRFARTSSYRQLILATLVALTTILSLVGQAQLAAAQDDTSNEEGQVQPGATAEEDPALQLEGTGSVRIHVFECPIEYRGVTGGDFFDACSDTGMGGIGVRLTTLTIDEVRAQQSGAGQGGAVPTEFDQILNTQVDNGSGPGFVEYRQLPADDYTVVVDLPGATNNFYSYCSDVDTGEEVSVSPNDENNGAISVGDGQNVLCDWFIIPDPNGTLQAENESGVTATATEEGEGETEAEATATTEPEGEIAGEATSTPEVDDESVGGEAESEEGRVQEPESTATDEGVTVEEGQPIGGAADGATITIDMRVCPTSFVDPNAANYDTFAASCTDGADNVTLRLTDVSNNNFTEQVTSADLNNTFSGLPDGTYTMYSNVPGDAASEYLFCVADGGNRYQKEFNGNGVTTFSDLTGEQITCNWYVVPQDQRGEETGGSLTLHVASCPTDYEGSDYFEDCHDQGINESAFRLDGPGGSISGTTSVPRTGGPGLLAFTGLAAGDYTLQGGPPGDFGTAVVYCSDQATNAQVNASVSSTQASFSLAEGQDLLCDWYFIPEDASGEPTPTEEPEERAEILITLFECAPREEGYAGWGFGDLDDTCTETVNDVPFRLGDVGAPPLTANTGVSGDGAVRFYDLLPANYTVKPTLPGELSNVALYCSLNGSNDVYQKSLENGETTFNDVNGEEIACSWFVTSAPEQPAGPSGSITVREFVCEGDQSTISDWDQECVAGATGAAYTLSGGDVNTQGTPNGNGVLVFQGLADAFYNLEQNEGTWCRATAEHVDSSSRVIVKDGANTDVYLYHCGDVTSLPSTGTGSGQQDSGSGGLTGSMLALLIAAVLLVPAIGMVLWTRLRRKDTEADQGTNTSQPTVTETGMLRMRFR